MRRALFTTLLAAAPRAVLACPVCFGQNDSPLALGINYGILAMLGFIGSLLLAFASFFIYLMRRARLADQLASGPQGFAEASGAAEGRASTSLNAPSLNAELLRHVSHAQEGTL